MGRKRSHSTRIPLDQALEEWPWERISAGVHPNTSGGWRTQRWVPSYRTEELRREDSEVARRLQDTGRDGQRVIGPGTVKVLHDIALKLGTLKDIHVILEAIASDPTILPGLLQMAKTLTERGKK